MGEGDQQASGEMRAMISKAIVRLQAEYYGIVVREESFTRAEKTLAERGEREAMQHIRRRFQQAMAGSFTSVVGQATGRKVRAFSRRPTSGRTSRSKRLCSPTRART